MLISSFLGLRNQIKLHIQCQEVCFIAIEYIVMISNRENIEVYVVNLDFSRLEINLLLSMNRTPGFSRESSTAMIEAFSC